MKKIYTTPIVTEQKFTADEYVAACWGVGCDWGAANEYEIEHNYYDGGNVSHAEDHCGNSGNQVIYTGNDKIADKMTEIGTDGLGTLNCTIYTDNTYTQTREISSVKAGEEIYWTTVAGAKVWHHVGTVFNTVPGHPNRS